MTIKCSVYIATSLDGFIARKDGSIDWLTQASDPAGSEDYGYELFFNSVDTLVMGRITYELALTFKEWPYAGKRVVVLSSAAPHVPETLTGEVEIMSGPPVEVVRRLAESGARHLYVDGGKTIQGFLRDGLIDEITITSISVLIGGGISLFGALDRDVKLELLDSKTFKNGYVQSKYRVIHTDNFPA